MNYRGSYGEYFAVCDFCDTDSSDYKVQWVKPIGEKGICSKCALQLTRVLDIKEAKAKGR